ncbi:hypothetical protein M8J77_018084 [Diaphorina citri]|nr:hypothetical protein M8J77_018084 [Diaphorina citri]
MEGAQGHRRIQDLGVCFPSKGFESPIMPTLRDKCMSQVSQTRNKVVILHLSHKVLKDQNYNVLRRSNYNLAQPAEKYLGDLNNTPSRRSSDQIQPEAKLYLWY